MAPITVQAKPLAVLPTTINIYEANAFRNVALSGDLLYILRYELPTAEWNAPTGPGAFAAFSEIYSDSTEATLHGRRVTPNTGDGLTGLYFAPGHRLTWNSSTIEFCITGNPVTFGATVLQRCVIPVYNDGSTLSVTSTVLGTALLSMMTNLEQDAAQVPGTYVANGFITTDGAVFPIRAFQPITTVAPQVFFGAVGRFNQSQYTPVAQGAFSSTTSSNARSSTLWQRIETVAAENLSIKGNALGAITMLIVTIGTMAVSMVLTKSSAHAVPFSASAGFIVLLGVATAMDFISMEVMFTVLALLTLVALIFWTKRAPS